MATATEGGYDSKMKTLVHLCAKSASPGGKLIHGSDNSTETANGNSSGGYKRIWCVLWSR